MSPAVLCFSGLIELLQRKEKTGQTKEHPFPSAIGKWEDPPAPSGDVRFYRKTNEALKGVNKQISRKDSSGLL